MPQENNPPDSGKVWVMPGFLAIPLLPFMLFGILVYGLGKLLWLGLRGGKDGAVGNFLLLPLLPLAVIIGQSDTRLMHWINYHFLQGWFGCALLVAGFLAFCLLPFSEHPGLRFFAHHSFRILMLGGLLLLADGQLAQEVRREPLSVCISDVGFSGPIHGRHVSTSGFTYMQYRLRYGDNQSLSYYSFDSTACHTLSLRRGLLPWYHYRLVEGPTEHPMPSTCRDLDCVIPPNWLAPPIPWIVPPSGRPASSDTASSN